MALCNACNASEKTWTPTGHESHSVMRESYKRSCNVNICSNMRAFLHYEQYWIA